MRISLASRAIPPQVSRPSRGVAQPGRAPALGAGSRQFESGRPDHQKIRSLGFYGSSNFENLPPPAELVAETVESPEAVLEEFRTLVKGMIPCHFKTGIVRFEQTFV